jgi:glucosamine 6-phosphate synthetase-like amidotransferase/phosphosugar isomerase protein
MSRDADPDVLVAARLGSPLMLGIGEDEWFSNLRVCIYICIHPHTHIYAK